MRRHIIDDKRKVEKSINHRKCFIRNACAQPQYKLRRLVYVYTREYVCPQPMYILCSNIQRLVGPFYYFN